MYRRIRNRAPALLAVWLATGLTGGGALISSAPADAQSATVGSTSMTLEELEAYIAEQKAALDKVREDRKIVDEKAKRVREALSERDAKQREVESEVEALCRERDDAVPGSFDDCMKETVG